LVLGDANSVSFTAGLNGQQAGFFGRPRLAVPR
jgi:hypothetical protein